MEKLSGKDKELIRGSWESLGKNKIPHGVIMFSRLFELDPTLLTLFHYTTNCGSTQDCLSNPEFLEHVTKVMLVIDAAVGHLDDLHSLEDFLLNLGRKHQAAGVDTQSFAVGPTFHKRNSQKVHSRVNERRGKNKLLFLCVCVWDDSRWWGSPFSTCCSAVWARPTRPRCVKPGSTCTASWSQR
ncbi:neuroglobin isoform X1 [Pseudoliparis swirei]|uniref:neuroglobin isoform X1 n=1 Tax=Pseudoliparis swirei TaxID=2059687 RepID=UPI0024BED16D|nr:neuroglobin isoform X1 [Pseudoliparis swirei]